MSAIVKGNNVSFEDAAAKVLAFREERDWSQFHNPKDLAISISIEAAELLEVFQWSGAELGAGAKFDAAKEELADVIIYCIYLADCLGVDIEGAVEDKVGRNSKKYPVEKTRGSARKYTEL